MDDPLITYDEALEQFLNKKDRESADTLLRVVAMDDDRLLHEETINLISSKTKLGKKVLRERLNEYIREFVPSNATFRIDKIVKIIPDDPSTEDYMYKFCITVIFNNGRPSERHEVMLTSSQLATPTVLERKLFEITDRHVDLPSGDKWVALIDSMMNDIMEVSKEEPVSEEWDIAERIINTIRGMQLTDNEDQWKELPDVYIYDCGDGKIMVSGSLITNIARQVTKRFFSSRKLRNILGEYMPDDAKSKTVRVLKGLIRVWYFDKNKVFGDDIGADDDTINKIKKLVDKEFIRAELVEGRYPSLSEIGVAIEDELGIDIENAIELFTELCTTRKLDYMVDGDDIYKKGDLSGE